MSRQSPLYSTQAFNQWTDQVCVAFPALSKPQATTLAYWSFGMVLARSCALTSVAFFLAKLLGRQMVVNFAEGPHALKRGHAQEGVAT